MKIFWQGHGRRITGKYILEWDYFGNGMQYRWGRPLESMPSKIWWHFKLWVDN